MMPELTKCPIHKINILGKECDICKTERTWKEEHDWENEE